MSKTLIVELPSGPLESEKMLLVDEDTKTVIVPKKTNADRIRAMSDEELAEYIEPRWFDCSDFCEDFDAGCSYTCKHNKGAEFLLNWLKSPTTD